MGHHLRDSWQRFVCGLLSSTYTMILVLVAMLLLGVLSTPAEAYVDPGTGGMLVQLLIGGLLAGVVLLRATARRALGWFARTLRRGTGTAD